MKKKKNYFKSILIILIIVFMGLYISSESGYYEAHVAKNVLLTEEAIKDFENDVLNGKNVDINKYMENNSKDYSNKFTDLGENITLAIIKIITEGVSGSWDAIKVLFF